MSGDTRTLIGKSWDATKRTMGRDAPTMTHTPATMAGLYLEAANDDVARALDMVPEEDGVFFELIRKYLRMVLAEERVIPALTGTG